MYVNGTVCKQRFFLHLHGLFVAGVNWVVLSGSTKVSRNFLDYTMSSKQYSYTVIMLKYKYGQLSTCIVL